MLHIDFPKPHALRVLRRLWKKKMSKLPLFRWFYYIFISEDNHVWDGSDWTFSHWEAKHYLSWQAIRAAKYQLRFNPHFKAKKSKIKAIFKP